MKAALLMIAVFLYVDKPVSTLQFDLDTPASTVSIVPGIDKQIAVNRVGGKLRVVVFGLNQSVFQGKFAILDSNVATVSNVVGSNPDATNANCRVLTLSQPKNLNAVIKHK